MMVSPTNFREVFMDHLSNAQTQLREMDTMAAADSPVHRLHPLCKLLVTVFYIVVAVSCPKYNITGLAVLLLYPTLMFQAANIPVRLCFYRLRIVLPLVCAVGIANPFLDHTPMLCLGNCVITGGVFSMLTLMLKGIFALMASFLLIATTPMDTLCAALRKLRVPSVLVTLLLLTYRYIGVMLKEVSVMTQAYKLRAPGQKGIHISAWGSFLGQLLLRSMDRAEELYSSMQLRGFRGEFYYAEAPQCQASDALFAVGCCGALLVARIFNLATLLGNLIVR